MAMMIEADSASLVGGRGCHDPLIIPDGSMAVKIFHALQVVRQRLATHDSLADNLDITHAELGLGLGSKEMFKLIWCV